MSEKTRPSPLTHHPRGIKPSLNNDNTCSTAGKLERYRELAAQLRELLAGERDLIANASNVASLLYHGLPELNWAGFYFRKGNVLLLGPFQGKPACTRIPLGRGVCGTAAASATTVLVENVHEFSGHIACDGASNSEIVVPLLNNGQVVGVLDLDSPAFARFDAEDRAGLEILAQAFIDLTDMDALTRSRC